MELLEKSSDTGRVRPVNLKKEIARYLRLWPWLLLSVALFYTAARVYLRYTQPQFLSKTSLKLQEAKANTTTALNDLKSLGMGVSSSDELQGETTVIVSKPILAAVARNLNLGVSFYSIGKVREFELYSDSPYTAKIIELNDPEKFTAAPFTITAAGNNSYRLSENGPVFRFSTPAKLPFGTVQIDAKAGFKSAPPVKVVFRNIKTVVSMLESRISVSLPPDKGMLMDVSVIGPVPQKSEDILNELTRQYLVDGVNDKNKEAQNTQDFINERLEIITADLSGIEGEKENFKRSNQITDLQAQAGEAITSASENTKTVLTQGLQLNLINSVLAATSGDQLIPSGMGLPSGAESGISEYNELLLTRNRVLKQATSENPAVVGMNKQLASLKNLIRQNLLESRETLELQIAQANAQLNIAKGNISKYPTQEKIFRSIDRQQTLKEQLYLYLLQKREENAITLAVTAPKAKIVNPAYTVGKVQPPEQQITLGAVAVGFMLPLLFFFVRNTLNTKVHSKDHILSIEPDVAVIGEIPYNDKENAIVHPNDFSVFAESFRILSSNLKFMLKAHKSEGGDVVLITSSVKGEGKTTASMNLALTLSGKNRVVVIGADIRNPQLHRFIDGENIGLTDYLVSDETDPAPFILRSGITDKLDVLFSGQIAPNPNDLLDMQKFKDLLSYLKSNYDYVIIDSAPVMYVSDTLHLIEDADVVVYMMKANHTEKEMVRFAADLRAEKQIRNMAFVLNGVKPENSRYGAPYGYGYGFYQEEKPKWWQRLRS